MIEQFLRFTWFQATPWLRAQLIVAGLIIVLAPSAAAMSTQYGAIICMASLTLLPVLLGWSLILLADFVSDFKHFKRCESNLRR